MWFPADRGMPRRLARRQAHQQEQGPPSAQPSQQHAFSAIMTGASWISSRQEAQRGMLVQLSFQAHEESVIRAYGSHTAFALERSEGFGMAGNIVQAACVSHRTWLRRLPAPVSRRDPARDE